MRLTERDFRLLRWVGEQFLINTCELTELLHSDAQRHYLELGEHAMRGLLNRWRKYQLVETFHQLRRGIHIYLTAKGTEVAGLPFKASRPRHNAFNHLSHHDALNRLRLHLEREAWQAGQELLWISERHLIQQERTQNGEYKPGKEHRPDAILQTPMGDVAIEVERTYKRPGRLKEILNGYLYRSQYALVQYYYSSPRIQQNVQRALKIILSDTPLIYQVELQEKIQILPLPFVDVT